MTEPRLSISDLSSVGAGKHSALLVDSVTITSLARYLGAARLDLEALCDFIECPPISSQLRRKELFFCYASNYTGRDSLHNWAFTNGWEATESRLPVRSREDVSPRLTSGSEIGASLSRMALGSMVQHVYLMANDLNLVPMLKVIREQGITLSLIHSNDDSMHPYNGIINNVDEVILPAEVPSFIVPRATEVGLA